MKAEFSVNIKKAIFGAAVLAAAMFCSAAFAETSGVTYINSETLVTLMSADKSLIVVDVRGPLEYAASHIKGAVSKPYYEIASSGLAKDAELVLYCSGIGCQISGNSAAQLIATAFLFK